MLASEAADIVVGEVQRLPELLHVVHDLLEEGSGHRFVLTAGELRGTPRPLPAFRNRDNALRDGDMSTFRASTS